MIVRTRHIAASLASVGLILFATVRTFRPQYSDALAKKTFTPVTHTVLFQFKEGTTPDEIKDVCARFASLKKTCRHPGTGREYILSLKGGRDNSPEGLQEGISHAFVLEFASVEHRDWYVHMDPTHAAFVKGLEGVVERAVVVDFVEGVYE